MGPNMTQILLRSDKEKIQQYTECPIKNKTTTYTIFCNTQKKKHLKLSINRLSTFEQQKAKAASLILKVLIQPTFNNFFIKKNK